MNYPVIVRAESTHQYMAQPLGIPEIKVVAAKVIHVVVPGEPPDNPWLHAFGRSATDPDFPEFLEEFERLRTTDTPA